MGIYIGLQFSSYVSAAFRYDGLIMQNYLTALAELFKLAAMHGELSLTGQIARLLELSTQPSAQLSHWRKMRHDAVAYADTLTLQDIDDHLEKGVRQ